MDQQFEKLKKLLSQKLDLQAQIEFQEIEISKL